MNFFLATKKNQERGEANQCLLSCLNHVDCVRNRCADDKKYFSGKINFYGLSVFKNLSNACISSNSRDLSAAA